jgi:cyclophilin family peptidyl-prolyl cis-trans isomerase
MKKFFSRSRRQTRDRSRQQSRRKFLAVESLEPRLLLHAGVDTPHGHPPEHALSDHIHAQLFIYIDGVKEEIPTDIGVDSTGILDFAHTHSDDEELHLHPADKNGDGTAEEPADFLTVGDFFEVWRTNAGTAGNRADAVFDSTTIFGNVVDATNSLRMYVNGFQVQSYQDYQIHDNDRIVISYGESPVVSVETNFGTILMEMLPSDAPGTVTNFLNYANDGDYDNAIFHRSVSNFVVQAGGFATTSPTFTSTAQLSAIPTDPAIVNEFGVSNTRGTVAMAKLDGDPDSATNQWFVNLSDTNAPGANGLDSQNDGFTVFARVLDMAPVDTIADIPGQDQGGVFGQLPIDAANQLVVIAGMSGDGLVSGTVYDDVNGNGSQDAGEAGLAGFKVFSDSDGNGAHGTLEFSTLTAADGSYQLQLPSGSHTLQQELTPPYRQATPTPPAGQAITVLIDGSQAGVDFGNSAVASPTSVDLDAAFDSGSDNSDNITSNNNSSTATQLQFTIDGVTDGALVRLLAGNSEIGQAVASGTSVTVLTAGNLPFVDGVQSITAIQVVTGGTSLASPALALTVDTAVADFTSSALATATIATNYIYDVSNPEEGSVGFAYSLTESPSAMTINATTGLVSWTPVANDKGTQTFTVRATDAAGNQRDQQSTVVVDGEVLVDINLELTDDQGQAITSIAVGEQFLVRALIQDLRTEPRGLFAAYTDVLFDANLATAVGPITYGASYPNVQTGSLQAGLLDEVGATSNINELGGSQFLLFSVLVRADRGGELNFLADPSDNLPSSDTLLYGTNSAVPQANIAYGSASLTVTLDFTAADDIFNFDEDSGSNAMDVMFNDDTASASDVTITGVDPPSTGSVAIAADQLSLSYTPALNFSGQETFTYTIGNASGDSQATVTVQVAQINDPPTANDDSLEVDEDSSGNLLDLLANDSFAPDTGETLSITATGATSAGGTVTIPNSGSHVLYTPLANFDGTESFTYTISDGNGGTDTATATIDIRAEGDNPLAQFDTITVDEDSVDNSLDVLANDTSPDSSATLTITAVSTPDQGGTVSIATDLGSLVYTPAANFFGDEAFTYTMSDGGGGSDTAVVFMDVIDQPDAPTANDDSFTVGIDSTENDFDVTDNDSSAPDAVETLTVTAVTPSAEGGTVIIATDGHEIHYSPPAGFSGQDSFSYTITDDDTLTDTATVTIDVSAFQPGDISGVAFIDSDGDGVQDIGELVLGGIVITLSGTDTESNVVNLVTTTDATGAYEFANLVPGDYLLTQTQPEFLLDGLDMPSPSGGTVSGDNQISLQLPEGGDFSGTNFSERGRQASTLSLADFFSAPAEPSLIVCTGTDPGFGWSALDASWSSFDSVVADLATTPNAVDVSVVQNGTSQDVTLDLGSSDPVQSFYQLSDNQLLGVFGTPTELGFTDAGSSGGDEADGESEPSELEIHDQVLASWPAGDALSQLEFESMPGQAGEDLDTPAEAIDLLLSNWFAG